MTYNEDFNGLNDFDFQDDEQVGYQGYPRIWWFNGVKQAGTAGHFYTSENEFDTPLGAPWTKVQRFQDGDGYVTEKLSIIPIRKRYQAFHRDANDRKRKVWLDKWEDGASLYTEILCFMQGYDGLVILAVKGLTGKALTGKTTGVFAMFADSVMAEAKKTMKKGAKLPPFSFWIPISCAKKNGRVEYQETKYGSFVTPPVLAIGEPVTRETALKLYVGKDMLEKCHQAWKDHGEWRLQTRTTDAPSAQSPQSTPPAKNIPIAIQDNEDDMF